MGQKTFEMVLKLVRDGYAVKFSKVFKAPVSTLMKIEVQRGAYRHIEYVDTAVCGPSLPSTDDIIFRALNQARFSFEFEYEGEDKND